MTKKEFQMGLKVFLSCGGPNPDEDTLEVWYRMLEQVQPKDFEKAIMEICMENKDLGFINLVAEILDRSKSYRASRRGQEWKQQFKVDPNQKQIGVAEWEKIRKEVKDKSASHEKLETNNDH